MIFKKSLFLSALVLLSSCSNMQEKDALRAPAADETCRELVQNLFLKKNYEKDLEKALVKKKLISFTNKFVTIEHPRLDWINRARASLNKSIKNWNNNKYPAFYIFNDEDIVPQAKKYFQTIKDGANPEDANFQSVNAWMKSFSDYQKDVDDLLEERISLQYNLSLLKKLKLKDEPRDIKLTIKRGGQLVEEIVTLRKEDKDLAFQIKKLKTEIKVLDGTLLKNGKIKDRVIRQAMLADIITILHREMEYGIKNTEAPSPELLKELEKISALLKQSEFQPTTYGVYRVTNKIFLRELAALTKVDVAYKKFVGSPLEKIKEIVQAFLHNRPLRENPNPNEAEKIGFLKRVYAKITSITPRQAAYGTGTAAVAGLGFYRYFWTKPGSIQELPEKTKVENADAAAIEDGVSDSHEEQVERTQEEDVKKSDDHSTVIEIEIDELVSE